MAEDWLGTGISYFADYGGLMGLEAASALHYRIPSACNLDFLLCISLPS